MELISTLTVGAGGAASITFSSIPATYTDLVLLFSVRSSNSSTTNAALFSLNGSTANFTDNWLQGNGSSASSNSNGGAAYGNGGYLGLINGDTSTANTFSNVQLYIPNYAGSTNKTFSVNGVVENNATAGWNICVAGVWANTSAITSLSLSTYSANMKEGTTASLYGILKGSGGATVA